MHYFILIYFNNIPLHVSSRLAAHHQEDQLCITTIGIFFIFVDPCIIAQLINETTNVMQLGAIAFIIIPG